MADEDLADTLAALPLFAELSAREIARIREIGRVEYWRAGTKVLEEGTIGPRLLILLSGRCDVIRNDAERVLASVEKGAVLGEISLLLGSPRVATVRAADDIRVFALERRSFTEMIRQRDPAALALGMGIARELARRVVLLNTRLAELSKEQSHPVGRLQDVLHRFLDL